MPNNAALFQFLRRVAGINPKKHGEPRRVRQIVAKRGFGVARRSR